MRLELAKAVGKNFSQRMEAALPQFVAVEARGGSRSGCLYEWSVSEALKFFVYLQFDTRNYHDCFTIELACSSAEYPFDKISDRPHVQSGGAVRFRLPHLYREEWRPKTGREPWWCLGEQTTRKDLMAFFQGRVASEIPPSSEEESYKTPLSSALTFVDPQVADAIDRIKRFGIPYFQKVAEEHGANLAAE